MNDDNKTKELGIEITDGRAYDEDGNPCVSNNEVYNQVHTFLEDKSPEVANVYEKAAIGVTFVHRIMTIIVCVIIMVVFTGLAIVFNIPAIVSTIYGNNKVEATITSIDTEKSTYTLTYEVNGEEKTLEEEYYDEDTSIEQGTIYYLYLNDDGEIKLIESGDSSNDFVFLFATSIVDICLIVVIVKSVKGLKTPNDIDLDNGGVRIKF